MPPYFQGQMNMLPLLTSRNMFGPGQVRQPRRPIDEISFGADSALSDPSNQVSAARPNVQTTPNPNDPYGLMAMLKAQQEEGPESRKYREFAAAGPPVRQDPGWRNKILAGASSFLGNTGPAGYQAEIDRPYNRSVQDWSLKDASLKQAADIESSNRKQNLTQFMDVVNAQDKMNDNADQKLYRGKQIENIDSQIAKRLADAKTQGWSAPRLDNNTGHLMMYKVDDKAPTGYSTLDLGKTGQTFGEASDRRVGESNRIGEQNLGRQKYLAGIQAGFREYGRQNDAARTDTRDTAKDAANPNKELANRALMLRKLSAIPEISKGIDLQRGTTTTPLAKRAVEGLLRGEVVVLAPDGKTIGTIDKSEIQEYGRKGFKILVQ